MPPRRRTMLTPVQTMASEVGALPIRGSCGQLLVYVTVSPGRSVAAAHADQKKKAASAGAGGIGDGAPRQRVLLAALGEEAGVVGGVGLDGAGAMVRHGDRRGGGVVGVGADLAAEPLAEGGLRLGRELGVRGAALAEGGVVEDGGQLAVQPVGGPVGRDVCAVAPDGAELHAAE
jgi:hypothetical protein